MSEFRHVVVDASAVIALIAQEKGHEIVKGIIRNSIISTLNASEVAKYLIEHKGLEKAYARSLLERLVFEITPFDSNQCFDTAELIIQTKQYGLSLADRACISLALTKGYPVYTGDRAWSKVKIENLNVHLIR
jgi:ribonuclease VapC